MHSLSQDARIQYAQVIIESTRRALSLEMHYCNLACVIYVLTMTTSYFMLAFDILYLNSVLSRHQLRCRVAAQRVLGS